MEKKKRERKRISHLHNVVMALEEKGYTLASIRYNNSCTQIEVTIDHPDYAGNRDFLEKAAVAAYGETGE